MQKRQLPSGLRVRTTCAAHALLHGRMALSFSILATCRLTISRSCGLRRYGRLRIGTASPVSIECSTSEFARTTPGSVEKMSPNSQHRSASISWCSSVSSAVPGSKTRRVWVIAWSSSAARSTSRLTVGSASRSVGEGPSPTAACRAPRTPKTPEAVVRDGGAERRASPPATRGGRAGGLMSSVYSLMCTLLMGAGPGRARCRSCRARRMHRRRRRHAAFTATAGVAASRSRSRSAWAAGTSSVMCL